MRKDEFDIQFDNLIEREKAHQVVPTGFPQLDDDLFKIGGLPLGKIAEIYGQPDTCKSLLSYYILANAQKKFTDKRVAIIDTEYRCSAQWLQDQGIDLSRCDIKQTIVAEEALNTAIVLLESGKYSVVLLDSIGNMESAQNLDGVRFKQENGSYKSDQPGRIALVLTQGTKRIIQAAAKGNTLFLAVNQLRDSIGSFMASNTESLPGGRNWKYNRTVALRLINLGSIKVGGEVVGVKIKAELRRSKISTPMRSTEEEDYLKFFLSGGQEEMELFNLFDKAVAKGILVKAGPWVKWESQNLKWSGREKTLTYLREHEDALELMKSMVESA